MSLFLIATSLLLGRRLQPWNELEVLLVGMRVALLFLEPLLWHSQGVSWTRRAPLGRPWWTLARFWIVSRSHLRQVLSRLGVELIWLEASTSTCLGAAFLLSSPTLSCCCSTTFICRGKVKEFVHILTIVVELLLICEEVVVVAHQSAVAFSIRLIMHVSR